MTSMLDQHCLEGKGSLLFTIFKVENTVRVFTLSSAHLSKIVGLSGKRFERLWPLLPYGIFVKMPGAAYIH